MKENLDVFIEEVVEPGILFVICFVALMWVW